MTAAVKVGDPIKYTTSDPWTVDGVKGEHVFVVTMRVTDVDAIGAVMLTEEVISESGIPPIDHPRNAPDRLSITHEGVDFRVADGTLVRLLEWDADCGTGPFLAEDDDVATEIRAAHAKVCPDCRTTPDPLPTESVEAIGSQILSEVLAQLDDLSDDTMDTLRDHEHAGDTTYNARVLACAEALRQSLQEAVDQCHEAWLAEHR